MNKIVSWCVLFSVIIFAQACRTSTLTQSTTEVDKKLYVSAEQILAIARMIDNNVSLWLVSNDVVEKSDIVKRNNKLIEDIHRNFFKGMQVSQEQSRALVVLKNAEQYFKETCLQ